MTSPLLYVFSAVDGVLVFMSEAEARTLPSDPSNLLFFLPIAHVSHCEDWDRLAPLCAEASVKTIWVCGGKFSNSKDYLGKRKEVEF